MSTVQSWPFGHMSEEVASAAAVKIAEADFQAYSADPQVRQELKRYFLILTLVDRPVTMQSQAVDNAWHAFILDTQNYMTFCEEVFGQYLHHKSAHYELDQEFPNLYCRLFGDESLPAIWWQGGGNCDNCA